ncbi:MAG TPA: hypothetical protein PKH78_05945, partial [Candidatus Obscuribacter sp.]|nr:hypothetical protein [Candidatus Obscuribacter sp.]
PTNDGVPTTISLTCLHMTGVPQLERHYGFHNSSLTPGKGNAHPRFYLFSRAISEPPSVI